EEPAQRASRRTHNADPGDLEGAWRLLRRLPGRARGLRLEDRQYLLGEEFQAALGHLVGRAAKAEGDVELEIADDLAAFFEAAQDLVGRAPARGLKALDRAFVAALAGDLGF